MLQSSICGTFGGTSFILISSIAMMISCLRSIISLQIDGVESLNNVLLIGMTNRKDLLDEALLRFLSTAFLLSFHEAFC